MKILLVNDDGYKAAGINVLDRVLSGFGHEIAVMAPTFEQSGKSHSMTLNGSKTVTRYNDNRFHIDGTPVDCVIYGIKSKILPFKPDLIVSGINHGYNLSTDIIYSGTCGAARQGAFYGYKAIALSEDKSFDSEYHFEATARFFAEHLNYFASLVEKNSFLNVNVPHVFSGEYEYASIGAIEYDDEFLIEKKSEDQFLVQNVGCKIDYVKIEGGRHLNDFEICLNNKASVSLLSVLPSCQSSSMEQWV